MSESKVKNKLEVLNVIASLIKKPSLLLDDKYPLAPDDFPERYHQIIFGAIDHLAHNGAQKIDEIVIDDYLQQNHPAQHKAFELSNGVDYIQKALCVADEGNFEYYYSHLKKYSLLRKLDLMGLDITPFYDPDNLNTDLALKAQTKFEESDLDSILGYYDVQLTDLRRAYCSNSDIEEGHISKGMRALKEELAETPAFGLPMNSAKMNTICHGRRLRKFYLKTLVSGGGKTRITMADACRLAIPEYYDPEKKRWVKTKCAESVLFITTELELSEIQTLTWAYIACVPEDHITDNKYDPGEEARVEKAIALLEKSKFYSVYISNFDVDDIESIIKRYKIEYDVSYIFFDYIFSSSKVFSEMSAKARGFKLREDQSLMVFSERLKTMCNKYNVHIDSSTQANDDWKTQKNPDQSVIRGAKAIADKVDVGWIGLEPTEKDKEAIHDIMPKLGLAFNKEPNLVYHVYKVRRGKINHVKVFLYFDYGTLRTTDMFVTDRDYKVLDVKNTNIEILLEQTDVTEEAKNTPAPKNEPKSFSWRPIS